MEFSISAHAERRSYQSGRSHDVISMVSVNVGATSHDDKRLPVELVLVVDRSGSMAGEKIQLMKQTLRLLVSCGGLRANDRLGVVTFDDKVDTALSLTSMDQEGRTKALAAIDGISIGGTTNLSGGLLQAIGMICKSVQKDDDDTADAIDGEAVSTDVVSRNVLLFTDGHANAGITSRDALLESARACLRGAPSTTISTFGYGGDHDEDLLRSLSQLSGGLFYHIDEPDMIPAAFADCLGGLMSVVAQNATLELKCTPGGRKRSSTITSIFGNAYKTEVHEGGARATVFLGDLYTEDKKDVLFKLELEELDGPIDAPHPVIEATLQCFSARAMRLVEAACDLIISRPLEAAESNEVPDVKLDEQRNRLHAVQAIEEATKLADRGDRDAGKVILEAAATNLNSSVSCSTELTRALVGDLQRLLLDYDEETTYRSLGSKRSKAASMCHGLQRSPYRALTGSVASPYSSGSKAKARMSGALMGLPSVSAP